MGWGSGNIRHAKKLRAGLQTCHHKLEHTWLRSVRNAMWLDPYEQGDFLLARRMQHLAIYVLAAPLP